mmetsp:Transcript_20189/g.44010  ORF Transcript_20189/g.44010 Transcript_20189/m.44010 type:complete len:332 (-) Transcript_20189:1545-2540(-)
MNSSHCPRSSSRSSTHPVNSASSTSCALPPAEALEPLPVSAAPSAVAAAGLLAVAAVAETRLPAVAAGACCWCWCSSPSAHAWTSATISASSVTSTPTLPAMKPFSHTSSNSTPHACSGRQGDTWGSAALAAWHAAWAKGSSGRATRTYRVDTDVPHAAACGPWVSSCCCCCGACRTWAAITASFRRQTTTTSGVSRPRPLRQTVCQRVPGGEGAAATASASPPAPPAPVLVVNTGESLTGCCCCVPVLSSRQRGATDSTVGRGARGWTSWRLYGLVVSSMCREKALPCTWTTTSPLKEGGSDSSVLHSVGAMFRSMCIPSIATSGDMRVI